MARRSTPSSGTVTTAMAHSVVPMPASSGSSVAADTTDSLASCTACTSASVVRASMPSTCERSDDTASSDATAPP